MNFELKDHHLNNLLEFLNRVPIQGFKELTAMNELLSLLQQKKPEKE